MKLKLQDVERRSEYHYSGMAKLADLAEAFKGYQFSEEVLSKAEIHKVAMKDGIPSFSVTVRIEPDSTECTEGEETEFQCIGCELRDGKSKVAAICQMADEQLDGYAVQTEVFQVTKEKMDKLEANRM